MRDKYLEIRGGTVFDPLRQEMRKESVFINQGKLGARLPNINYYEIDAEGCIVSPGWIDYHVHYYNHTAPNGVNPDACSFPCGITTAVDAGTCGPNDFGAYVESIFSRCDVRLLAQLHVAAEGQMRTTFENITADALDEQLVRDTYEKYSRYLVGLKTRLSADIVAPDKGYVSLRRTVEIAEKIGCNVVVHCTNPSMPLAEIIKILRKGDVLCHIYQDKGGDTILDKKGIIKPEIVNGREKGIIFDASNGVNNFNLKLAQDAIHQGFFPDIISSDMNRLSSFVGPLHSLPRIMSKYLALGMGIQQILTAVTAAPAALIGREELASMDAGTEADLTIAKLRSAKVDYQDHTGINHLEGNEVIVPQMTIKGGQVYFSQVDFG